MKYLLTLAVCALAAFAVGCTEAAQGPKTALIITDANFDETIKAGVVLVDFWATWCPPCRTQGPIVERIALAYTGRVVVGKLDVDKNPKTSGRFGITAIPTLIIFKDGKVAQKLVGLRREDALKAALDKEL